MRKLSKETRKKMSESAKRKFQKGFKVWNTGLTKDTSEKVKRMADDRKGYKFTTEAKKRMSTLMKKRVSSKNYIHPTKNPEVIKKIVETRKRNGGYNIMGETREKISKTLRKKKITPPKEYWYKKGVPSKFKMDKSPNWKGGVWAIEQEFRRKVRKRDNYICMVCGKHQEKEGRSLQVHHINYDSNLHVLQNGISLCCSCHGKVDVNRGHWIKFFHSLLSNLYSYNYSPNGEIIMEVKKCQ